MKGINFHFDKLKTNWVIAWQIRGFRIQLLTTLLFLASIAFFVSNFFRYIEFRESYRIRDVILNLIPPVDLSVFTFLFIYSVIILSILNLISFPFQFLKGLQAYGLLLSLRLACMYAVPLDTPADLIILKDPFIGYFFYGKMVITKDLFFSGHVSTLFLLCLLNQVRYLRFLFYFLTFLTAIALLVQHVHYTVDVIAAPFFAWIAFALSKWIPIKSAV
ncbi:MAG: phosphatase PAP2-related protein [bacterium]|nr:phosphatase PAP2-related protein [bacterium]